MIEASQAFRSIDEHNENTGDATSLREIVSQYLERWQQQNTSISLEALFKEYVYLKSHRGKI
jgi:hypothetical protein